MNSSTQSLETVAEVKRIYPINSLAKNNIPNLVIDSLFEHAANIPNKIALIGEDFDGNSTQLTYRELADHVQSLSATLLTISQNYHTHCIALKAENSLDWVLIDLCALHFNLPIVPVPTFFSDEQIEHILNSSGADLLIGDWQHFLTTANLPIKSDEFTGLSKIPFSILQKNSTDSSKVNSVDSVNDVSSQNALPANTEQLTSLHDTSYLDNLSTTVLPHTQKITFTSGSTGHPKGVCLSRNNLNRVSESLANAIEITPKQHLVLLPLSTLLENITGIYVPILVGSTSVILNGKQVGLSGSSQFDARQFARALATYTPNTLVLTPALLLALLQLVKAQPQLATSLEFVAVGGASVAKEYIEQADQLGIPVYEGYGLSECASVVCLNTPSQRKAGSCGKPLAHVEVQIHEDNELWVSGNIAIGYLGEPFTTTWFATGDLAHIDPDGFVQIYGRKKNLLISSFGRNISPEWIETQVQVYFPMNKVLILGDGQPYISLLINCEFDESVKNKLTVLNKTLPDYAQIKSVLALTDFAPIKSLFTANGRPKRHEIHQWIATQSVQQADQQHRIQASSTFSQHFI